jgi:hypothetical protein
LNSEHEIIKKNYLVMLMKAYQLHANQGFNDLKQVELPTPQPQAIDRVFDFKAVPEAYQYLQSGTHFSKLVVSL